MAQSFVLHQLWWFDKGILWQGVTRAFGKFIPIGKLNFLKCGRLHRVPLEWCLSQTAL
jgi:hypothetical protein